MFRDRVAREFSRFGRLVFALPVLVLGFGATVHAAQGRTQGAFSVSPTGAATYSIPIWAPPGPDGVQPGISLVYNSQAEVDQTGETVLIPTSAHSSGGVQVTYDGYLGVGWSLGGLSAIFRCNLTAAQDAAAAPVTLQSSDAYCLDGQRLRLTAGTYGAAGSTYQTEVANFANVTASGTAGNGPASFIVQHPNGVTYYYGATADSQVLANGTSTAWKWLLNEVVDPVGNTMTIKYTAAAANGVTIGDVVPSVISWTPSSHGSSAYNYTMTFNYGAANAPQSSVYKYVAGTSVTNTTLLTSIKIAYSGTTVKQYNLLYQQSPTTKRERLYQVQECADSAGENCLLPSTITYQNGSAGVATTASTYSMQIGTQAAGRYFPHYDLNGDGYDDLLMQVGTTWYVAWGSATGYSAPVSTNVTTPFYTTGHGQLLAGDVRGTGQDGLLANNGGTWYYYTWNGTSFVGVSTGVPYDTSAYAFALADTDGDGLPDLVSINSTAVYIRLNNSGTSPSFGAANTAFVIPPESGFEVNNGAFTTPDSQSGSPLRRLDFNGDGKDDLQVVIQYYDEPDSLHVGYRYWLLGNGSTFTGSQQATGVPLDFVNWNDDSCTDYIVGSTLTISACNGNSATTINLGYTPVAAMDWDGDGRTDLIYNSGGELYVQLSTGVGLGAIIDTGIPFNSSVGASGYWGKDINGDGLDDLIYILPTATTVTLGSYLHSDRGQRPDLAISFADGYGNSASPTYVSLVQNNYTPSAPGSGSGGYYPYTQPLYVASEVVYSDPTSATGATWNQQFWYYSGGENIRGRGFQGFAEMRTIDSRNGLYDYQYFLNTFPYTGMLYQEIQSQGAVASSNYVSETTGTQAVIDLSTTQYEERYFPYFSTWRVQQFEVGGTEAGDQVTNVFTSYSYDNYGNATSIATSTTDWDPASPDYLVTWTTTTTNTPDVDTTHWCLGLLTETQVAYTGGPSGTNPVTRTKTFPSPDTTHCRYTQIVTEPSSTQYMVTETLGYDPTAGTLLTDTVTGVGMAARTTTYGWDLESLFPLSIKDSSGAQTQVAYNYSLGLPASLTDPNSSAQTPIVTSWQYDPFGRESRETRPDGTATTWTYNPCPGCDPQSHLDITETQLDSAGNTISAINSYEDMLERLIHQTGTEINGEMTYTLSRVFDSLGRVVLAYKPFLGTANAPGGTVYSYDILNRPTVVSRNISASNPALQNTTYAYAGRTTTITDALSNPRTILTDVNGRLWQTKDAYGYTVTSAYDAAGSKTSVTDSQGNTLWGRVTYAYGVAPFLLGATDMDQGAWTYGYDALGEMTSWKDAKGQQFSATYDALSRPATRTEPDYFTQWTWGSSASSHNLGKLQSVCTGSGGACTASGYSETEAYDAEGRPYQRAITIPGTGTFTYTSLYNATTGLLDTLTYPTSTSGYALQLKYAYFRGILQSITDISDSPNVAVWTANATDPMGHVTQETLGNGIQTNRAFDGVTGWLSSTQAGVSGGTGVKNLAFLYDLMGNVTQRQDNNLGLTENIYYDNDYRLSTSKLNGAQNLAMAYDPTGNITSRSDVASGATWTYDSIRKHAVTQAGSSSYQYSYDANGNVTSRQGSSIGWSSYNYPTAISAGSGSTAENVAFSYGPDRQRWQQSYSGNGTTETTSYVGGLMEVVTSGGVTTYRHYVAGNGSTVAVYSRSSSGTNAFNYLLTDHQASVAAITNSSGGVVVNESFTPFGARRNSSTWVGAASNSDLTTSAAITRQGYTGQTAVGLWTGLNHMNGRVEDAITGRFLSADPVVPDSIDTQSYNRYSYVNNRPLSYVDPSGFDACGVSGSASDDGDDQDDDDGDGDSDDAVTGGISRHLKDTAACTAPTFTGTRIPGGQPPPGFSLAGWQYSSTSLSSVNLATGETQDLGPGGGTWYYTGGGFTIGSLGSVSSPGASPGNSSPQGNQPTSEVTVTAQRQYPYNPLMCARAGLGCDPTIPPPSLPICFGTFAFAGREGDLGGVDIFAGQLVESTVPGLDVGPLYEAAVGPEGAAVGGAVTQSLLTGKTSGFAFGGGKLSLGPLAGVQAGSILGPNELGMYFEGHRGLTAGGIGFAFSTCP